MKYSLWRLGTLTHLSDSLWTSSPPCRRPPDSASVVYTWQLCDTEHMLELLGVMNKYQFLGSM